RLCPPTAGRYDRRRDIVTARVSMSASSPSGSSGAGPSAAPGGPFRRVLLKVSGEALMGDSAYGVDIDACGRIAQEVSDGVKRGVEICLVIGGGNIFRGLQGAAKGMERASADYIGMLA